MFMDSNKFQEEKRMIDINKKLQDLANDIVKNAIEDIPLKDAVIEDLLKGIVMMCLKQGFIFGVATMKQTSDSLLKIVKGDE